MTAELLASIASILLSLLFSYVPGFTTWYNGLNTDIRRLVMLGLLLLVSLGSFGIACLNWFSIAGVTCSGAGAVELLRIFILAVVANQATYAISPYVAARKERG